jgi:hypothetical protein
MAACLAGLSRLARLRERNLTPQRGAMTLVAAGGRAEPAADAAAVERGRLVDKLGLIALADQDSNVAGLALLPQPRLR